MFIATWALAQEVTITIPDGKLTEFKVGYLTIYPVPLDEEGTPTMSENMWIKQKMINLLKRDYKRGKRMLHERAMAELENIDIT